MKLSHEQLAELDERGFIVLPSLFSVDEVEVLRAAADEILLRRGPEIIPEEEDENTVKMVFAAHTFNDTFHRLGRHPRLVQPAEQILGEGVHLFQTRLNAKSRFNAGGWAWHQDFNQWYRQDAMRTPRAVVAGVFVDDVNPCNGPVLMIPGSQRRGHIMAESMEVSPADVEDAAARGGIVPLMGPPGTMIIFDCLVIHGSAPNISPWPRRIFYCNYSPVSIREMQPLRSVYHCDTEVRAVEPLADDCLLEGVTA